MSGDIFWLSLTLGLTALLWFPYVLDRVRVRGVLGTLANPSAELARQAPWAERARQAHANAVENLAVFAPAVLVAHSLGLGGGLLVFAGQLYFFSRLAHYIVYSAGIIGLRTLAFTGGWIATMIVVLRIFGLA